LLLAGAGALLILLRLLGTGATVGGLAAIVAGTVLVAPYAERPGAALRGWWTILAIGALIALGGSALELVARTPGGLVTVLGGTMVVVAAGLGFPLERDQG
jgi:hypothetical protein